MSVHNAVVAHQTFPNRLPNVIELFNRLVVNPAQRWRQRRKAIEELNQLDDKLLADIGIMRSEIPRVIDGKYAHGSKPLVQPSSADRTRLRVEQIW